MTYKIMVWFPEDSRWTDWNKTVSGKIDTFKTRKEAESRVKKLRNLWRDKFKVVKIK